MATETLSETSQSHYRREELIVTMTNEHETDQNSTHAGQAVIAKMVIASMIMLIIADLTLCLITTGSVDRSFTMQVGRWIEDLIVMVGGGQQ